MTSIDIPRDDIGTLTQKLKNATATAVTPTNAVQPYPAIGKENQIRQIVREQFTNQEKRRKKERRQGERRRRQEPVLLDTRSHRDRRQHGRRQTDQNMQQDNQTKAPIKKGFDDYA